MLEGSLSVASAYKKGKIAEIKERAATQGSTAGVLKDLHDGFGRYPTVYHDAHVNTGTPTRALPRYRTT